MAHRLKLLGAALAIIGILFIGGAGFTAIKVKQGADSLQAFSAAQNVMLTYNEDGQLVDRGEVEGAQAILSLLENDWNYPVNQSELNPNDPLVNTGTEYMYQMALVAYHTLNSTQQVTLTEDAEYNGESFPAGTYDVAVDGKYWADFDRMHPLEGPARALAWTGTAHALIGELGVGSVTASTLQMGYGIAALIGGLGLVLIFAGVGLAWAARGARTEGGSDATAPSVAKEPALV